MSDTRIFDSKSHTLMRIKSPRRSILPSPTYLSLIFPSQARIFRSQPAPRFRCSFQLLRRIRRQPRRGVSNRPIPEEVGYQETPVSFRRQSDAGVASLLQPRQESEW